MAVKIQSPVHEVISMGLLFSAIRSNGEDPNHWTVSHTKNTANSTKEPELVGFLAVEWARMFVHYAGLIGENPEELAEKMFLVNLEGEEYND